MYLYLFDVLGSFNLEYKEVVIILWFFFVIISLQTEIDFSFVVILEAPSANGVVHCVKFW